MIHINLLPGAAKRKKRQEIVKLLSITFSIFALAAIGFGILIALIFSQNLALKYQINKVEGEIEEQQAQIAEYKPVIDQTKLLKAKLTVINDIIANYKHWSDFLVNFSEVFPSSGVKLVSLAVGEDFNMQIAGLADSTSDLARLLITLENANTKKAYSVQANDNVAKIAKVNHTTPEALYSLNEVANEEELLAKGQIVVPLPFFKSVEVAAISPQSEEEVDSETERNINFSLTIVLNESTI